MKKLLMLTVCLFFLSAGNVLAETELQKHTFEVGTEISYIAYEEPNVMKETGAMYGIVGSYAYHDMFMAKAEAKWSCGLVDYDGQLTNGSPLQVKGIFDNMVELRGLVGYDVFILESTALTPYIGFGYRYLNDDMSCSAYGYERESNYLYSPVGLELISKFENGWSIGGMVEYDIFWYGLQKSHAEDLMEGLSTINNEQNSGWGTRGSIKIQKDFEQIALVIEPFVRYWNIGKSGDSAITYSGSYIGYAYEPKNNSLEIGSKISILF